MCGPWVISLLGTSNNILCIPGVIFYILYIPVVIFQPAVESWMYALFQYAN